MALSIEEENVYSAAANVAEEVLSGIRTVFAFGGEQMEIVRYGDRLMKAERPLRWKSFLLGLREGILRFLYFSSSALAYWYGVKLVLEDRNKVHKEYTPTVMLIVCYRENEH